MISQHGMKFSDMPKTISYKRLNIPTGKFFYVQYYNTFGGVGHLKLTPFTPWLLSQLSFLPLGPLTQLTLCIKGVQSISF